MGGGWKMRTRPRCLSWEEREVIPSASGAVHPPSLAKRRGQGDEFRTTTDESQRQAQTGPSGQDSLPGIAAAVDAE